MTTVGIVGAGTMGTGIAQVALEAGDEVLLYDVDPAAMDRARGRIADGLGKRAARLGLDADSIDDWVSGRLVRLRWSASLDAMAREAELIVEAAIEDLEPKQAIFRALDSVASPDVLLATNTSALSVGSMAAVTTHPERVLGLHFFNPVPVMGLVEVVSASHTDPFSADRAAGHVARWGKTTVRCADTPGFIVNRVNRPYTIEALRMVEADDASVEIIDAAMRDAGYPMGPFELMDLVGIDVNLAAARSIWERLGRPEHLRPSPIQERLVAAGRLGRKTGAGFYDYIDGVPASTGAMGSPHTGGRLTASEIAARIERRIAIEARQVADDGIATEEDIALALRLGAGHPRSPFAT